MEEGGGGEGGGFVGVGAVDGDVEGLVGYLPEEDAACLFLNVSASRCGSWVVRGGLGEGGEDF